MVLDTPTLPSTGPNPAVVTAITILVGGEYPPGIWKVTLTYSDSSTATYGLVTKNVQYWIDYCNGIVTDLSRMFVKNPGAAVVSTSTKAVSVSISDNTPITGN